MTLPRKNKYEKRTKLAYWHTARDFQSPISKKNSEFTICFDVFTIMGLLQYIK